jgi:hypothetical protein
VHHGECEWDLAVWTVRVVAGNGQAVLVGRVLRVRNGSKMPLKIGRGRLLGQIVRQGLPVQGGLQLFRATDKQS